MKIKRPRSNVVNIFKSVPPDQVAMRPGRRVRARVEPSGAVVLDGSLDASMIEIRDAVVDAINEDGRDSARAGEGDSIVVVTPGRPGGTACVVLRP